jgi:2-oxoacid:acceptor oxidoreductase gamma subunit (pyruvate/2-ketoisovalerate family)
MEIRLHGRGGQGGVTCAKILAATWAQQGKSVQAFGDYAGERSGAPVRAYVRVDDAAIINRNKVYNPDHVLVLDHGLLDASAVAGLRPGGTLMVNTSEPPDAIAHRFPGFRVATVDATAIARAHGIGSRSLVIVNTTIAGAFARALDLDFGTLEAAFTAMHVERDLPAARAAWDAVVVHAAEGTARASAAPPTGANVLPLESHLVGLTPALRTGSWRSSTPQYQERPAPCANSCPAGNDVVGFVQAMAKHGAEAAAAIIAKTSPFAAVCGRVCPGFCGQACNRIEYDGAVNTRGIERWIGDHAPIARADKPRGDRTAAVIGAGPAGISAAYQLARAGWNVELIDAADRPGGLLRSGIPPWRLPRDVLDKECDAVLDMGVAWKGGTSLGPADVAALAASRDAVILATGQVKSVDLDVPGRALNGIEQGLEFLRGANRSLASQMTGHIVIIGGGNTAIDCARSARRRGAEKVTVVYRRGRDQMPAIPEEVDEAEEEGIHFAFFRAPVAIYGDDHVGGIELAVMEGGQRGAKLVDTGTREIIACDEVLLAIGQVSDPSVLLPAGWHLDDGQAFDGARALPVFAAGDLFRAEGTVAHAIGDGARMAATARAFVGEGEPPPVRRHGVVEAKELRFSYFDGRPAAVTAKRDAYERVTTSAEVAYGLDDATSEAERCLSCGHCTHCDTCLAYCPEGIILRADGGYAVDLTQCKGCGMCASECPRGSIQMVTT